MPQCVYCESQKLRIRYCGLRHPHKKEHGPFDIYSCESCCSLITYPLPTEAQQASLYSGFTNGFIPAIGEIRKQHPLPTWYEQCIERATKLMRPVPDAESSFTWIDIGAGSGELASLMAKRYPNSKGFALDFHPRPVHLERISNLDWIQADLNSENFADKLQNLRAELAMSITVLEHVLHPDSFLKNIFGLMKKPAAVYLTVPCVGSIASVVLGKKWPYLIPGEHLNIPSIKGMNALLNRLPSETGNKIDFKVQATTLPYTSGYYMSFLKLRFLKKIVPGKIPVRIPTGILEASVRLID